MARTPLHFILHDGDRFVKCVRRIGDILMWNIRLPWISQPANEEYAAVMMSMPKRHPVQ